MIKCVASILFLCFFIVSCKQKSNAVQVVDLQATCVKALTDVVVHDIFSPPVTSRIYAYTNLAYYEAIRLGNPNHKTLLVAFKGFDSSGISLGNADATLAAVHAYAIVAEKLVFSKDSIKAKIEKIKSPFQKNLSKEKLNASYKIGETIAKIILARAAKDKYKETRGMPRFSAFAQNDAWQQTPPDYADAIEPHWQKIAPLLLDSFNQFAPIAPPPYSKEKNTVFYKEVQEVYNTSSQLTMEQEQIARYWDDNPMTTNHKGHFTFATKKTTPVGHWMGIVGILAKTKKLDDVTTAYLFATASASIFDGFISCWAEKYGSMKIRPITAIREFVDPSWDALLQTPPFPEYTSGHSVISTAAATVLQNQLGDMPFMDTSIQNYIGMKRSFNSITSAAEEASISRLYGGIHYRSGIVAGQKQGQQIGALFNNKLKQTSLR